MPINVQLSGVTQARDGYFVAKIDKFGVFAYADSAAEANDRVVRALDHLLAGIESEDELTARLDRAGIAWTRQVEATVTPSLWTTPASITLGHEPSRPRLLAGFPG